MAKETRFFDTKAEAEPKGRTAKVDLPMGYINPVEYVSTHVEIRMSTKQAEALKSLQAGLESGGARLANGKLVNSLGDALRFFLESVG